MATSRSWEKRVDQGTKESLGAVKVEIIASTELRMAIPIERGSISPPVKRPVTGRTLAFLAAGSVDSSIPLTRQAR